MTTSAFDFTGSPDTVSESVIEGCHIILRQGLSEPLFSFGGDLRVCLVDYAIVPLENTWLRGGRPLWRRVLDAFRGRIEP